MLLLWIGVFILALSLLVKASDWFVDSAEKIGLALGIPSFIIGVTIVAAGTSLPELASSIVAVLEGTSEFVAGNVIGSNITNIFLVLGVSSIVAKKINIRYNLMNIDMPMLIGSALLLWAFLRDQIFSLTEAFLSLCGLVLFLFYTIKMNPIQNKEERGKIGTMVFVKLIISCVLIYFGAEYTVKSASEISVLLNIGTDVVALTMVAFGTSVPELIVSIVAARKGNPEIAVGNILGSNIFNTFAVMGIPALFGTLKITPEVFNNGLPFMLVATFMFLLTTQNKKVVLWEGWILVLFYVFYVLDLILRLKS